MKSRKLRSILLIVLVLLFFNNISSANLVFQMTASDTTLVLGEPATIGIWAEAEEAVGMNGINIWQLDLVVDFDNVIMVTDVDVLEPAPLDPFLPEYVSINTDFNGNVYGLGGGLDGAYDDSSVGVGGLTLLANITIEAIGVGVAEYEFTDIGSTGFYAYLRDQDYYDIDLNNIDILPGNTIFMVTPEPASLVIMAVMAGMALRSRKIGAGR